MSVISVRSIAFAWLGVLLPLSLTAKETAGTLFRRVSETYSLIEDYTARMTITRGANLQRGNLSYKAPDKLRIDFTYPESLHKKVINVDGEQLQVYLPAQRVLLVQTLEKGGVSAQYNLATSNGLALLKRHYSIGYKVGPNPVLLQQTGSSYVIKLRLRWKSSIEGFRELILSVDDNSHMIRRIEGTTAGGEVIQFDFEDFVINKGIPTARFRYETPPEGSELRDFLFDPEE